MPGRFTWRLLFLEAAVDHAAAHHALLLAQHLEVDQAVVDRDPVAHLDRVDDVGVVDLDRALLDVLGAAHHDGDLLALAQVQFRREVPGADLGALGVQHHRHRVAHLAVQRAYGLDHARVRLVVAVRHVEPHDVHAGGVEPLEHLVGAGCGAYGADDLGLAHRMSGGCLKRAIIAAIRAPPDYPPGRLRAAARPFARGFAARRRPRVVCQATPRPGRHTAGE